jgi:hypothetical protein
MSEKRVDERSLLYRAGCINLTQIRTGTIRLQDGRVVRLSLVDEADFRAWFYWLIDLSRKQCKSNHAAATLTILFNDCERMSFEDEEARMYILNELNDMGAFRRTHIALFVESEARAS